MSGFYRNTGSFKAMPPLPPEAPIKARISWLLVNFLTFHNRLDGWMSFVAVWWALWTLAYPDFWVQTPPATKVTNAMLGLSWLISWALLFSGAIGYISKVYHWRMMRTLCFFIGFSSWCTLALAYFRMVPMWSPGVATYSASAIAKLMAYVNFQIGTERVDGDVPAGP